MTFALAVFQQETPTMWQRRTCRESVRILALAVCIATVSWTASWAQNENETVGFQSTHVFERDALGDTVDILNGGLTLAVPIGPRYEVNQNLGYQLALNYSSKIWDRSSSSPVPMLVHQSGVGLGFALHFGRIYRDIADVEKKIPNGPDGFTIEIVRECTWYYVSPDGNQHELPTSYDTGTWDVCFNAPSQLTRDGTYLAPGSYSGDSTVEADMLPPLQGWNGTGKIPAPVIITPDGTRLIFGHYVPAYGPAPNNEPLNRASAYSGFSHETRRYNQEFGGWYVTRIEDRNSGYEDVGFSHANRRYKRRIEIAYDTTPGREHLIQAITDTAQATPARTILFVNGCSLDPDHPEVGCATDPIFVGTTNSPLRASARVEHIRVPAFAGAAGPVPEKYAQYDLNYDYRHLQKLDCTPEGTETCLDKYRNLLREVVYPTYSTFSQPGATAARYHMTFDYSAWGELESRELPTGARVGYVWADYNYLLSGGSGSNATGTSSTRQIQSRGVDLETGEYYSWFYKREVSTASNPRSVVVEDPFGNDTIYYFHASRTDNNGYNSENPEDGWTPEWNDGLNYRTDYFAGKGPARVLVRTEEREYTSSRDNRYIESRSGKNTRVQRESTTYYDDGGRVATTTYSDWDEMGHWHQQIESGFDVPGVRLTKTEYFGYGGDQWHYKEVSDGSRVVSRVDQIHQIDATQPEPPKVCATVAHVSAPTAISLGADGIARAGDITTWFKYDAESGNIVEKALSDEPSGGAMVCHPNPAAGQETVDNAPIATHRVGYSWQGGGYLSAKQFATNPASNPATLFSWKAIDRDRDGNTGLIYAVRDTAGVATTYDYDELGRLKEVRPQSPEYPTRVEYLDIHRTSVRQGAAVTAGSEYTCAGATGDAILSCYSYDQLGRQNLTEKRPYDTGRGISYQKTDHHIDGRVTFESEWSYASAPASYCKTPLEIALGATGTQCAGTKYRFEDDSVAGVIDPFGRVRKTIGADNAVTRVDYFGLGSQVTVEGIQGVAGPFEATTRYYRDAFNRLIYVDTPSPVVGESTVAGGARAEYEYDPANNLVRATLFEQNGSGSQSRFFEYDQLGRLTRSVTPEEGTVAVTRYDALGNVLETVDGRGTAKASDFDPAGRVLSIMKTDAHGPLAGVSLTTALNVYDTVPGSAHSFGQGLGRLLRSESFDERGFSVVSREFEYSGLNGRLKKERTYFSSAASTELVLETLHNNFGLPSKTTYPEGAAGLGGAFSVNYVYANGFLTKVRPDTGNDYAVAKYNPGGGMEELATQGSMKTVVVPDARNRPGSISIGKYNQAGAFLGALEFETGAYHYDGAGNIYKLDGPAASAPTTANTYGYDAANRLVAAQVWNNSEKYTEAYEYDDYGNMTRKLRKNTAEIVLADDRFNSHNQTLDRTSNRLLDITPQTGPTLTVEYDGAGNLVRRNRGSDIQTAAYDAMNRMTSVASIVNGVATVAGQYQYDAGANRVEKHEGCCPVGR